jgi:hypothetical protein
VKLLVHVGYYIRGASSHVTGMWKVALPNMVANWHGPGGWHRPKKKYLLDENEGVL